MMNSPVEMILVARYRSMLVKGSHALQARRFSSQSSARSFLNPFIPNQVHHRS